MKMTLKNNDSLRWFMLLPLFLLSACSSESINGG